MRRAIKIEDNVSEVGRLKAKIRQQAERLVKLSQSSNDQHKACLSCQASVKKIKDLENQLARSSELLKAEVLANEQLTAVLEDCAASQSPPPLDFKAITHRPSLAKDFLKKLMENLGNGEVVKEEDQVNKTRREKDALSKELVETIELKSAADGRILGFQTTVENLNSDVRCLMRIKDRLESERKQAERLSIKATKEKDDLLNHVSNLNRQLRLAEDAFETIADGVEM